MSIVIRRGHGACVFFLNLQTKTWNKIYIRFTSGFDFNACHDYHCLSDIEKQRLHLERGRGGRKEKKTLKMFRLLTVSESKCNQENVFLRTDVKAGFYHCSLLT